MYILKHKRLSCYYGGKEAGKPTFVYNQAEAYQFDSMDDVEKLRENSKLLAEDYNVEKA